MQVAAPAGKWALQKGFGAAMGLVLNRKGTRRKASPDNVSDETW